MTTEARQQFEKWAKDHGSDLRRAYDPDENRQVYVDNFVEDDWEMWQAARLSGLQQAAASCPTCGSDKREVKFTSHFSGMPILECSDPWHGCDSAKESAEPPLDPGEFYITRGDGVQERCRYVGQSITIPAESAEPSKPAAQESMKFTLTFEQRETDPEIWIARCAEKSWVTTGRGFQEAVESMAEIIWREHKRA